MKIRTKAPHHLVALASAAVVGVYSAGFLKTRAAAARFVDEPAMRRPVDPEALVRNGAEKSPVKLSPAPASTPRPASNAALSAATTSATRPASASRAAHAAPEGSPAPGASVTSPIAASTVAAQSTEAPAVSPVTPPDQSTAVTPASAAKYVDGTYLGWGTSRHGDIQAKVVIEHDRITSATIAQCLTRWDCSWISPLPPQVIARQSAEVDFVSGATQSTNAFYYAVLDALTLATRK